MPLTEIDKLRHNRWYFGGLASAMAVSVTHPLDLIKVHLQTQHGKKQSIFKLVGDLYRRQGILGFYNGISASLTRQLMYATTRFGIYESAKNYIHAESFQSRVGLAVIAGLIGGLVGVPADVVNVRMQNDMKLPPEKRRNYRHVFDGFIRVYREEGLNRLFAGSSLAVSRGILLTIGQNVMYDQVKEALLNTKMFDDNPTLHITTSVAAATIATLITQPMDVMKTRAMNAKPGEFKSVFDVIITTAKEGPLAFYKGIVPAFMRLGPHTVLLYMIMEQMRLHFGYLKPEEKQGSDARKTSGHIPEKYLKHKRVKGP